jgi:hypothetical protein
VLNRCTYNRASSRSSRQPSDRRAHASALVRLADGEADFHALEPRHRLVNGFNAMTGKFTVSEEAKTWDVHNRQVHLRKG